MSVITTTIRCYSYSWCGIISFSSLSLSCLPLLAEDFDRYLPSSGFLFSVWEWFLRHTAWLIYLKIQREIIAYTCCVNSIHIIVRQKLQSHFRFLLNTFQIQNSVKLDIKPRSSVSLHSVAGSLEGTSILFFKHRNQSCQKSVLQQTRTGTSPDNIQSIYILPVSLSPQLLLA